MSGPEITCCPGTLAAGFDSYSKTCLNRMFFGRKVSHVLPYLPATISEADAERFLENRKRLSISGVQEKVSLTLDKNKLRLTAIGEQGLYILKPVPRDLKKAGQVPANEHLTMQIARQVYGIPTAENALIFFRNGEPAYLTRRFDVREHTNRGDGRPLKWGVEDFASVAGRTAENAGSGFKYGLSYEALADLLVRHVPAHVVEREKLFRLILFNYLFSNGDAHLKNFCLIETPQGDHVLSPAYDLINTRIHVDDSDFALEQGLFRDDFRSPHWKKTGHAGLADFQELASRMGIPERRWDALLGPFRARQPQVAELVGRSFLREPTRRAYWLHYQTRRNRLDP